MEGRILSLTSSQQVMMGLGGELEWAPVYGLARETQAGPRCLYRVIEPNLLRLARLTVRGFINNRELPLHKRDDYRRLERRINIALGEGM